MSSILSSLLGEARKGAINPTAASNASPQKRAVVPAKSKITASTSRAHTSVAKNVTKLKQAEHGESVSSSTAAQRAAISHPSHVQAPTSPLRRPNTLSSGSIVDPRCSLGTKGVPDATHNLPVALIRREGRPSTAAYKNMSVGELRFRARRRSLQLMEDSKHYLIMVLLVYDEEYDQLYTRIGNPLECESYARAAVEHYNKQNLANLAELRWAAAKRQKNPGTPKEAHVSTQKSQVISMAFKPTKTLRKTVESVEVIGSVRLRQGPTNMITERKSRLSTDSGYSTGSTQPATVENYERKKIPLPEYPDDEPKPSKKAKLSIAEQEILRVVKKIGRKEDSDRSTKASKLPYKVPFKPNSDINKNDVEKFPAKKVAKGNKTENRNHLPQEEEASPSRGVMQPVSRRTRRKTPAEPTKALDKRKGLIEASNSESEDDWLLDDGQA
ncbi:predicted protein [Plenodomus lingam JN3]|uniref:Predicted protein n=1 Tax=Leptosphaeria maculans (strain JN3 / isolate v23.1.3 / race Av1-4-5-6-7-8) TaxID=985895 RepID=E5A8I2_LEPMJ|nr:predicted protein [Plenodomus lingam JN3]CBX99927.1 predicted protein [Plenodomus lingam JN3]